jgi:hypothetical protein
VKWLKLGRRIDGTLANRDECNKDGNFCWKANHTITVIYKGKEIVLPQKAKVTDILYRMLHSAGTFSAQRYPDKDGNELYINLSDFENKVPEPRYWHGVGSPPEEQVISLETYLKTLPEFGEF